MPDSRRAEARTPTGGEADVNSLSETLLDEGLARYFDGRYEDAIHLWTRVLFLDRSHARARAYIDRARSMLAERQRRSDEMLETSRDLLEQGHTDAARHLLSEAIATSGDDDRASALRLRLDQHERASAAPAATALTTATAGALRGWTWKRWRWTSIVALAALVLVIAALTVPVARNQIGLGSPDSVIAASTAPTALPILSSADVALVRARNLYNGGRLAEALQALDRISPDSAVRAEADVLRVNIQRLLLASGQEPSRALQSQRGSVRR